MKKCFKGHMYPDSLAQCPMCEKENELQTILGKSSFTDIISSQRSAAKRPSFEDHRNSSQSEADQHTSHTMDPDIDKTIFMGHATAPYEGVLGGWLVELNRDRIAVGSHQLFLDKIHSIGRSRDNDIILVSVNKSVSRHHCTIAFREHHFVINDRQSANGIFVNDRKILSHPLNEKDLIVLGDQAYRIKYL